MKVHKIFTLDIEIAKKLEGESNASGLVNALVTNHYNDNRTEEQIIKDVKIKVKEKEKKEKIKKMVNKQLAKEKAMGF